MKHQLTIVQTVLLLTAVCCLASCGKAQSGSTAKTEQGNLQDAIKARTEVVAYQQEVAANVLGQLRGEPEAAKAMQAMRKVVAKAESKQEEGNILLTKDRYTDAAAAYNEAAKLYRQSLDWRKVQKDLTKAERGAAAARLMAEAAAKPDQLKEAGKFQINAEGYLEAGEIEKAIAEYDQARNAFAALAPGVGGATLEQAIAARTAMQAARDQIKNLPPFVSGRDSDLENSLRRRADGDSESKGPKPGSMPDLLNRAQKAESAANDALEERQYGSAAGLFVAGEKLYKEAAVLQGKREAIAASRKGVEDSMKLADKAIKGNSRPASFERGKQALADAEKALADDDFDATKKMLAQGAEQFAAARADADKINALSDAQQAWASALAAADEELLNKHAASQFQAAKAKAADAQAQGSVPLFQAATAALNDGVASAKTKENASKATPVIARLDTAVGNRDKFAAEDVLAELEALIPSDPRMAGLRERVAALPGPKKNLTVDLGGGVTMDFLLVRPGSFQMGSEKIVGESPGHKVTITKPIYLGKYEVTQEQWERVMGSNPSTFKGAKNPVETVSWEDCQNFLAKLKEKVPAQSFRLPTEAEWEYACRAGSTTDYSFGDSGSGLGEYAWYGSNSGSKTHPVGEKKPNAWGLFDMHGNVWEWCADWYGPYTADNQTDPVGPSSGSGRVLRGGSWCCVPSFLRSSYRGLFGPGIRRGCVGLRCAFVTGASSR